MTRCPRRRVFLCCLLALAAGCGKGTGTITGTVRYKGTPLTSGTIIFHGAGGYTDSAAIGPEGEYRLADFPPGEARITVITQQYEKAAPGKPRKPVANFVALPQKYSDPKQSGPRYTVERGRS